ncbi:guanylate kinase [Spiroplasma endosymbiont of Anurida maritima]|uniref:guanylate kinase n=1 Tax=Spiroplasma endosymbiont of Anurida maritima TaxID=2967972 RepID=UPI0036D3BE16
MKKKEGFLLIISGPSGVGKGTICKKIFKNEELNLEYSVSKTTREKREGEVEGKDYFFVSKDEFKKDIENDNLLEYTRFVGNYYGTPRDYCQEQIKKGKNVLLEIEVHGANQVMRRDPNSLSIFLVPPSLKELEQRIRDRRSESEDIIEARLAKAKEEIPQQVNYDYVVVNNTVEQAALEIERIITSEMSDRNSSGGGIV